MIYKVVNFANSQGGVPHSLVHVMVVKLLYLAKLICFFFIIESKYVFLEKTLWYTIWQKC